MKSHNNQLNHKAVSEAIKSLNAKDKEAVYRFMEIAEAVAKEGDERIARNIRDRVLRSVSDDLVSESWVQEIFTLLNDAVHQARKSVKEVIKKPVSKSKKQPNKGHKHPVAVSRKPKIKTKAELAAEQAEKEAMPGVFREVIVTGERGT